jgi:acyl-CoA hydrolase
MTSCRLCRLDVDDGDNRRMLFIARRPVLFALVVMALAGCGQRKARAATALPAGATVLALGDSITAGAGAPAGADYPAQLAALSGWNVINGGVGGDTSAQALERLPALLVEHRPALVIVSIGGNDFLRRIALDETEGHLRRIVAMVREANAQPLLVAIPEPTAAAAAGLGLSDHPVYERLADELQLPLHENGWSTVLGDARLRSDNIHANAAGYRRFAEGLAQTLRETGLLAGSP